MTENEDEKLSIAEKRAAERLKVRVAPGALKLEEARHYLGGIADHTMRRLIKRGLIRPNKSTRHLIFPVRELDRFLSAGQIGNSE